MCCGSRESRREQVAARRQIRRGFQRREPQRAVALVVAHDLRERLEFRVELHVAHGFDSALEQRIVAAGERIEHGALGPVGEGIGQREAALAVGLRDVVGDAQPLRERRVFDALDEPGDGSEFFRRQIQHGVAEKLAAARALEFCAFEMREKKIGGLGGWGRRGRLRR